MIFNHFFRSKHQNPDPQVRLQAIENLNKKNPQHKTVLHELAFNDSDGGVSLAALHKLDNFVLWYKMSEIAKNDRVQKKAQQFVENTLSDVQNQTLTEQEKRKFILETRDLRLIEKLLEQQWIQQDTELAMLLLQKVDKPQLQEKLLFDTLNESLQTTILKTFIDNLQTRKLLNKIKKRTSSNLLIDLANEMLQGWIKAEQAPLEVEQQVKMVLSRLLALKDQSDVLHVLQQQTELTQQYTKIAERFVCLPELKRAEIQQKYTYISLRVERTIELLKPKWQAQQDELSLNQSIDTLLLEIEQNLTELSTQLTTGISEITPSEIDSFVLTFKQHLANLQNLSNQLQTTDQVTHRRLEQIKNRLLSSLNTLINIPKFQQAIQLGYELLEKFTGLVLPNDVSQIEASEEYIKEQKQEWRNTVANYQAHIPATLLKDYNEHLKLWQHAIKVLKNQINAEVSRCRNKLKAIENLINQGKFKAAMGMYQKVQNGLNVLPEKQQGQLERTFDSVKEKIENLKDWQDYIAAPRKPALLNEVQALIDYPLDIDAQSSAIKSFRYQWNSLGKTDTESDQALNEAFESAIEKAFSPCRAFYDQQQQQREQNMLAKQQVLVEIKSLDEKDCGISELIKALIIVQQEWKNIGEVDFKKRNALYDSYQNSLNPLRNKVSAFYQENAEKKQALITKAEQLLEMGSIDEAIGQAKKLQQTWKTIEHAGKKAEAELWPKFRKLNDSLFAQKAKLNLQQQTQLKEQISSVKEQVKQLENLLDSADSKASVQNALQGKQSVVDMIAVLPMRDRQVLEQQVQAVVEQQKVKLAALAKSAKGQTYHDLFSALKMWQTDSDIPDGVTTLSRQWQQCFRDLSDNIERHDLTIKMEIVAQQDSPQKDANKRQFIQMHLMAQKLQSGDSLEMSSLLKDWIRVGSLSEGDITLLKRVEPLFVS